MKAKEFNELLIKNFPELKKEIESYLENEDGVNTGSFLVIEDVFMKYFYLKLSNNDIDAVNKICEYIENIYLLNDKYSSNVIVIGVLENLKSSEYSDSIKNYLLPLTLNEYEKIKI